MNLAKGRVIKWTRRFGGKYSILSENERRVPRPIVSTCFVHCLVFLFKNSKRINWMRHQINKEGQSLFRRARVRVVSTWFGIQGQWRMNENQPQSLALLSFVSSLEISYVIQTALQLSVRKRNRLLNATLSANARWWLTSPFHNHHRRRRRRTEQQKKTDIPFL